MKKLLSFMMLLLSFGVFAQVNQTIIIENNTACTYEFTAEGTHNMSSCIPGFLATVIVGPQKTNYYKIVELTYSGPYVLGSPVNWLTSQINAGCGRTTTFDAPCSSGVQAGFTSPTLTIVPVTLPGSITCTCSQGTVSVYVDYQANGNVYITIN